MRFAFELDPAIYEDVIELGYHWAGTWKHAQRLILVIIDRPDPKTGQLPLIQKHFFLVTNWPQEKKSAAELLEHYRCRGTFEDRLGDFNAAIGLHLSPPQFQVILSTTNGEVIP